MRRGFIVLGVIACGFAIATVYFWRELDQERARSATLRERLAAKAPLAAMLPEERSAPPAATVVPSKPAPEAIAPATPPPVAAKAASAEEEWNERQRQLLRDPRYRELQLEQGRLTYARRRANLVNLLGFTPEQADAVIDLQLDRQLQQEEQAANPATGELALKQHQLDESQENEHQAKLREVLGDSKYAQLEHYMESRQSRMQVDTFRGQLSSADALRDDQVEPLIEALHVERARVREEMQQYSKTLTRGGESNDYSQLYGERYHEMMKEMHAGMRTSAATILSSSQLKQLDTMLNRELRRHEAHMRMSQIQSKIESAGGAAPQSN